MYNIAESYKKIGNYELAKKYYQLAIKESKKSEANTEDFDLAKTMSKFELLKKMKN